MDSKENILTHATEPRRRHSEERLFPFVEECCELTVACRKGDYSASQLARAVEDCDAHLLNLNVTDETTDFGETIVELRVNHRNGSSVARSIERYGYRVIGVSGADDIDSDTMRRRVNELLAHLEI